MWGDATGYVWGRTNETVAVPIPNIRERQTYYGAINLDSREFLLRSFESGNGESTVSFIKYLQRFYEGKKLLLVWDRASYHGCSAFRSYLAEVNRGLEEPDWRITCLTFAPNAPEQNPVEDVWLKGKNFLRKHFYENKTFQQVKSSFFNFLNQRIFDFNKLEWYF